MKVVLRIFQVLATLFILWLLLIILFAPHRFQYYRLALRGQKYYSDLAAACDGLIAKAGTDDRRIRGDELRSLPSILQDLKPDYVKIWPDGVILENGGTWDGIIVYWVSEQDDPTLWRLVIRNGESPGNRVFSRRKLKSAASH
jgi:hypothetical protein